MSQVPDSFYAAVLAAISAPVTHVTLACCHAWQACEGGDAANNPWNTTMPDDGTTDYNSAGVKNYPSEGVGVHATVKTLQLGYYDHVRLALQTQDVAGFGAAVDASPWGTHGVADYLAAHPVDTAAPAAATTTTDSLARLPLVREGAGMPPKAPNHTVAVLQGLLLAAGYSLQVDGRFGPSTDSCVRAFQTAQHLTVDGIAGPHTFGRLLGVS